MENWAKQSEDPTKKLLHSEELYKYILETTVYPREPEPLKELRNATASHPGSTYGHALELESTQDILFLSLLLQFLMMEGFV
ncbi:hypothetical protein RJ641_025964 [Dillenia turbinata]|uniref:Uncharacterized protein n=1 Tax=Dillenia turbinata TaxID=194707 RepID=A0AAN8WF70_9MAGN